MTATSFASFTRCTRNRRPFGRRVHSGTLPSGADVHRPATQTAAAAPAASARTAVTVVLHIAADPSVAANAVGARSSSPLLDPREVVGPELLLVHAVPRLLDLPHVAGLAQAV